MLQAAMGWQDSHLHEFRIGSLVYATPDKDGDLYERKAEGGCMWDVR